MLSNETETKRTEQVSQMKYPEVSTGTLDPGLYLVATPIGNLGDITLRALDVLKRADIIYCEDTRVSGKLLGHFGIDTPRQSYHEHNAEMQRPRILKQLADGKAIALITDAGTPLVSDPGYKLVADIREAGCPLFSLPGASAPITALTLSGLPSDRFLFAGFLAPKSGKRCSQLQELSRIPATLLFFESNRRLPATLDDMQKILGAQRIAAVTRELTKLHEEVRRGTLEELALHYAETGPPKGEIVIVVAPPNDELPSLDSLDTLLESAMEHMSMRDAVDAISTRTGQPRKEVYARALALRDQ